MIRLAILIAILTTLLSGMGSPLYLAGQTTESAIVSADAQVDSTGQAKTGIAGVSEIIKGTQPKIKWRISLSQVVWAIIFLLAAYLFFKYLSRFLEIIAEKKSNLRLFIKRLIPIIRILGWSFVIYIVIAGIFSPPIETLIAATASVGIAVGFASQDILKNIFGGIMILFDRPFQVGDKIQVGDHYGEVMQIGLRTVRIVTADDSLISIPNSEIVSHSVSNSNSGEFNCQVVAEFFLPLSVDINRLKTIAYRAAAVSQYAYLNKPIAVIVKNEVHEGRSLLKVRLKAYVLDLRNEFKFSSEMTETVVGELFRQGLIKKTEIDTMRKQEFESA